MSVFCRSVQTKYFIINAQRIKSYLFCSWTTNSFLRTNNVATREDRISFLCVLLDSVVHNVKCLLQFLLETFFMQIAERFCFFLNKVFLYIFYFLSEGGLFFFLSLKFFQYCSFQTSYYNLRKRMEFPSWRNSLIWNKKIKKIFLFLTKFKPANQNFKFLVFFEQILPEFIIRTSYNLRAYFLYYFNHIFCLLYRGISSHTVWNYLLIYSTFDWLIDWLMLTSCLPV